MKPSCHGLHGGSKGMVFDELSGPSEWSKTWL